MFIGLFVIYIYLFIYSHGYIVLPFHFYNNRKKAYTLDNISGKDFLELTTNKLVSTISIGSPLRELELYITMDYNLFFIGRGYCESNAISFYEPFDSTTFKNNSFYTYPFDDLRNMTIGNDSCSLYENYNLKSNKTLENVHLMFGSKINILNDVYDKNKVCGIMGLQYYDNSESYYKQFIPYSFQNSLKENNLNYTDWSIEFFNDNQKKENYGYDGFLIFGARDEQYLKNIKKIDPDNVIFSYISYLSTGEAWRTTLKDIYYKESIGNKTMKNFKTVEFKFDLDYYFVTKEYFESIKNYFFQQYIDSGICKIGKLKEFYLRYNYIFCNSNFKEKKSEFPTLFFEHKGYEYTFELTSEDCFKEINGHLLFLLFYDPWSPDIFKLGQNFMKKYQFIFSGNSKNIGFINYKQEPEKENTKPKNIKLDIKQLIWIFILLVLLIGIIIGVFIGKKVWDRNRKIRANELLDDDYVYDTTNNKQNIN